MTKKDIWTNGDLFGKNLQVWQKLKQDDKRGMSIIVGFTKMTNSRNWRIWIHQRSGENFK